MSDEISLKWGTLKAWNIKSDSAKEALRAYADKGMSLSAMAQRDMPEQRTLLCALIDAADCETIYLDWDDVHVSKDEAKKYVMSYGLPLAPRESA